MPVLAHDVFTDQPNAGPYVIFPTHAHQILSNCVHIFGVSVLSYCFARRTEHDRFTSAIWWNNLTWARLVIILVFLDSWFFLAFSGVLVNGVGLSYSVPVCSLGIFGCIFFYAGSKALTYLFLVERVWVVSSAGKSVSRRESLVYKVCACIVFGYTAIFIVMILGRYASIRDDGVCIIGLRGFATIPLLTYDFVINIFLTSMFLWFLCREQSISDRLRRLAKRTAFAAGIALTTSCVNILILALLDGRQLGWVCLSSCAADVTVNALVLFWVTAGGAKEPHWHGALDQKDVFYCGEPNELPPLNFPVSFVADPEARACDLVQTRTFDAGSVRIHKTQGRPGGNGNGRRSCLANIKESAYGEEDEFREGSSKDGHRNVGNGLDRRKRNEEPEGNDDDDKSICLTENIEWDITDSSASSSGFTHYDANLVEKNDPGVDPGAEADKQSALRSWRLAFERELEKGNPPPSFLVQPRPGEGEEEPDSPATTTTATHGTGESSRSRLTTPSDASQASRVQRRRLMVKEQRRQRRKRWNVHVVRPRPASRQGQGYTLSNSRPAPARSSQPQTIIPSPSLDPDPLSPRLTFSQDTRTSKPAPPPSNHPRVLRSRSDSVVRVYDQDTSDSSLFSAKPRHSQ